VYLCGERKIKICTKCNKNLPLKNFNKNNKSRDGLQYRCKQCEGEYAKSPKGKSSRRKYHQSENGKRTSRKLKRNYIAKKRGIIHDFTEEEWQQKLESTNGICLMCNKNVGIDKLALDHIIPVSKAPVGLVYTIDDVQPICGSCNSQKGNKIYMIDYSKLNLQPRKDLKKRIINNHTLDLIIYRKSKELYSRIVKLLDGDNPTFTESEVIFLNEL